jgi:hypothetical protein
LEVDVGVGASNDEKVRNSVGDLILGTGGVIDDSARTGEVDSDNKGDLEMDEKLT